MVFFNPSPDDMFLRNSKILMKLDFPEALQPTNILKLLRFTSKSLKLLKLWIFNFVILIILSSFIFLF